MAVVVASFLAPRGTIEPALFPNEEGAALSARLQEYISQATQQLAAFPTLSDEQRDAAIAAWVYCRAYGAVVQRLSITPQTVTLVDQGSVSYSAAQIKTFAEQRDRACDDYAAILASVGAVTTDNSAARESTTLRVRPVW